MNSTRLPQDDKRINEAPLRRPKWLRHLRFLAVAYLCLFVFLMALSVAMLIIK